MALSLTSEVFLPHCSIYASAIAIKVWNALSSNVNVAKKFLKFSSGQSDGLVPGHGKYLFSCLAIVMRKRQVLISIERVAQDFVKPRLIILNAAIDEVLSPV